MVASTGVKLMPHRHGEDRIYTVISGVFYVGLGNEFDPERLQAYPPGAVIMLPRNTSHFHRAKSGEYITQVTAIGPLWSRIRRPKGRSADLKRWKQRRRGLGWRKSTKPRSVGPDLGSSCPKVIRYL